MLFVYRHFALVNTSNWLGSVWDKEAWEYCWPHVPHGNNGISG